MTFWVAGAIVVGGIGSSLLQSDAAGNAADTQSQSTAAATGEQRRQYDTTREDFRPYREVGYRTLPTLESEVNRLPTPQEVMSDPGYQFGLDQGQKALDRKAAAAGGRVSGASLKAASEYATNYATTGYDAAYKRRQDRLNRLAALAGIGQTAVSGGANLGQQSSNAISGLISSQGDATAAAGLARGNIWGNAINSLTASGSRVLSGGNNSGFYPLVNEQSPGQYSLGNAQYG